MAGFILCHVSGIIKPAGALTMGLGTALQLHRVHHLIEHNGAHWAATMLQPYNRGRYLLEAQ